MILAAGMLLAIQVMPVPEMSDAEIGSVVGRLSTKPNLQVLDPFFSSTPPPPTPVSTPSLEDYIYCVSDAAERLDPSREPVNIVVDAAGAECRHLQRSTAAPGSVLASLPNEKYQELMSEFREMVGRNVSRRLVALRACRNTVGCDVTSVAPAFADLTPR